MVNPILSVIPPLLQDATRFLSQHVNGRGHVTLTTPFEADACHWRVNNLDVLRIVALGQDSQGNLLIYAKELDTPAPLSDLLEADIIRLAGTLSPPSCGSLPQQDLFVTIRPPSDELGSSLLGLARDGPFTPPV